MRITLRNDFHDTACRVNLNEETMTLTKSQLRRIHRELCGSHDCKCGWQGIRGSQRQPNGDSITFGMEDDNGVGVAIVSRDDRVWPQESETPQ